MDTKTVKLYPHNGRIPQIAQNDEEITTSRYLIKSIRTKYDNQPIVIDKNSTIMSQNNLTENFLHKAESKQKS